MFKLLDTKPQRDGHTDRQREGQTEMVKHIAPSACWRAIKRQVKKHTVANWLFVQTTHVVGPNLSFARAGTSEDSSKVQVSPKSIVRGFGDRRS